MKNDHSSTSTASNKYILLSACIVMTNWIHGQEIWTTEKMIDFQGVDFGEIASIVLFFSGIFITLKHWISSGLEGRSSNSVNIIDLLHRLKIPILILGLVFFNWKTMWSYVDANGNTIIERTGFGGLHSFQLFLAGVFLLLVISHFDRTSRLCIDDKNRQQ